MEVDAGNLRIKLGPCGLSGADAACDATSALVYSVWGGLSVAVPAVVKWSISSRKSCSANSYMKSLGLDHASTSVGLQTVGEWTACDARCWPCLP